MIKELLTMTEKQVSLSIVDGTIESVRNKNITKVGYRVYDNGYIGVAGGIGDVDVAELEKEAISNLELKVPYEEEVSSNNTMHIDRREMTFDAVKLIEDVEKTLEKIKAKYPTFSFSNKINMTETYVSLNNSSELDLSNRDLTVEVALVVREEKSISIMDTGVFYGGRQYDEAKILEEADRILGCYYNEVELPQVETMPVIIQKENVETKLIQELNGESVGRGSSLFKDFIGEQKFSELFTYGQVIDEESYHTPFFDAEGVVNPEFTCNFIENGKIIGPYADKKTSRTFGYPLTGSSQSSYDGVPTLSVATTKVQSTGKTLKELLNGDLGVLVVMASGGDYTPEGQFGYPVQHAILTDGEKMIGRLPLLNISSNLYEMFGKDYRGCSSDKVILSGRVVVMDMKVTKG